MITQLGYEKGKRDREAGAMLQGTGRIEISGFFPGWVIKLILAIVAGCLAANALVHVTPAYPIVGIGAGIAAFVLLNLLGARSRSAGAGGFRGVATRIVTSMILCAIAYDGLLLYAMWRSHETQYAFTPFAMGAAAGGVIGLVIGLILSAIAAARR